MCLTLSLLGKVLYVLYDCFSSFFPLGILDGIPLKITWTKPSTQNKTDTSKSYAPVQVTPAEFGSLQGLDTKRTQSALWVKSNYYPDAFECNEETGVVSHVHDVIFEIAKAYKVPVKLRREMTSFDIRPGILILLSSDNTPLAIIEVKSPSSSDLEKVDDVLKQDLACEKHSVYGQIYKYLVLLREKFGIAAPIGIVTTYNWWSFCSLDNASHITEAVGTLDELRATLTTQEVKETLLSQPK